MATVASLFRDAVQVTPAAEQVDALPAASMVALPDELLRHIFRQACNVLEPRCAVALSSASHGLWALTQEGRQQLKADHEAATAAAEAAAEKLELEIAARERPHVPTARERDSQAREERTKQWRAAVRASGSLLVYGTAGCDRLAADWESHRSERALAVQQMQMQQRVHLQQQQQQHDAPSSAVPGLLLQMSAHTSAWAAAYERLG